MTWKNKYNARLEKTGFVILVSILMSSQSVLHAQRNVISEIKTEGVVFVLPTSSVKLGVLQDAVRDETSPKRKRRLQRWLDQEQVVVDSFNTELTRAVDSLFTFSPYEVVLDTMLGQYLLLHEKKYIIRKGRTENGAPALLLLGPAFEKLSKPIPYFAKILKFSSFLDAFFNDIEYPYRDLHKVIGQWNRELEKYLKKQ